MFIFDEFTSPKGTICNEVCISYFSLSILLEENGEAKTPKIDDQTHSDKSFDESFPFHVLKQRGYIRILKTFIKIYIRL